MMIKTSTGAQRYNDRAREIFEDAKILNEFRDAQQAYAAALHADPDTFLAARLRFVAAREARERIQARDKARREQRARWRERARRQRAHAR